MALFAYISENKQAVKKFTRWGGVRINRRKTPEQITQQLNRISARGGNSAFLNVAVGHSAALPKYGIEYDTELRRFNLSRKGRMNGLFPISIIATKG